MASVPRARVKLPSSVIAACRVVLRWWRGKRKKKTTRPERNWNRERSGKPTGAEPDWRSSVHAPHDSTGEALRYPRPCSPFSLPPRFSTPDFDLGVPLSAAFRPLGGEPGQSGFRGLRPQATHLAELRNSTVAVGGAAACPVPPSGQLLPTRSRRHRRFCLAAKCFIPSGERTLGAVGVGITPASSAGAVDREQPARPRSQKRGGARRSHSVGCCRVLVGGNHLT